MENLQIFKNEDFGEIRTLEIENELFFVGKDVAEILGYKNHNKAIKDHIEEEDKGVTKWDTPYGKQKMVVINESGLYSLILSSKLPNAKKFKRWVTSEVLPAIRKTGGYIPVTETDTEQEILAKAMQIMDKTIKQQNAKLESLEIANSELTVEKQIMQPKAEYFDSLVDRHLNTGIRETAKELQVKEKTFVAFLIDKKYLYRDKRGKLMPYANHITNELFTLKECINEKTNWGGTQTLITPKGKETFRLLCVC